MKAQEGQKAMSSKHGWKEGVSLATQTRGPITREDLVRYAEASGDDNRIHLDDQFAQQAGFPSVIAHGMLSMAYLADLVRFNFPDAEFRVAQLKSRFRKVTFPGDTLELGGEVRKEGGDQENRQLTVHLWARNQKGEVTTDGEVVLVPLAL